MINTQNLGNQSTPALSVDRNGTTHLIWNEAGKINHAYYYTPCNRWLEASFITNSQSGFNLSIQPDVAIQALDGTVSNGVIATWVEGRGNEAEIYYAVGQQTSLGEYRWSDRQNLSQDALVVIR